MSTLCTYYNTEDDSAVYIGTPNTNYWSSQTFEVQTAAALTSVKLKLYRIGAPGTITVSIRNTYEGASPAGEDLDVATTEGDTLTTNTSGEWREIEFNGNITLTADTRYAIVVRASAATLAWRMDSAGATYGEGILYTSVNGGSSWTAHTDRDFMFEVWGDEEIWRRVLTEYMPDITPTFAALSLVGSETYGINLSTGTWTSASINLDANPNIYSNGTKIIGFDNTNFNILLGLSAFNNDAGLYNIGLGHQAGYNNDSSTGGWGDYNIYIGYLSGYGATESVTNKGNYNIGIGYKTLYYSTTGVENAVIGNLGMFTNTSGQRNTATGHSTLYKNSTGSYNSAFGYAALYNNTGTDNTGLGFYALYTATGSRNTVVGSYASYYQTTGTDNLVAGYKAGGEGAGGSFASSYTVMLGTYAGYRNRTGSSNIFIGYQAGCRQTTNSNLLIIDNQDRTSAANETTTSLVYGIFAAAAADQSLYINAGTIKLGTLAGLLYGTSGTVSGLGAATNGQLPIGSVGNSPTLATLTAGSGIDITNGAGSITIASTLSQYTDELAQDAVGGILDDGTVGEIVFTYDDNTPKISGVVQDGEIDHNSLANYAANQHFLQTAITNVSTALSTGLLKVTTGTGALSVLQTDVTGAELEELTDGSATTLHSHAGGDGDTYTNRGDPAGYDFVLADFTTDGAWHDLDLSSIVPAGAKAVYLYVAIQDDATNSNITFRENGNTNNYNKHTFRTQVANLTNDASFWASCDANRIIEYNASNLTFKGIFVTVRAWII